MQVFEQATQWYMISSESDRVKHQEYCKTIMVLWLEIDTLTPLLPYQPPQP